MKKLGIIILIFLICLQCKSQSDLFGTFKYKRYNPLYIETLILHPNGHFDYSLEMDMGVYYRNIGNWQQRDSCLILDSNPQKEKMLIMEFYEKQQKEIKVKVISKDSRIPMYYHLTAVLSNNDTIVFKDQYMETIIKERPISFWITNTVGLRSSEYKIKSVGNRIEVLFENERVFENEQWKVINTNRIKPRGLNGYFYNYYLEKELTLTKDE